MQLKHWAIQAIRILFLGLFNVTFLTAIFPLLGNAQEEAEPEQLAQGNGAQEIQLTDTLRFVVRPTIFGLVPPTDAANFGEVFIRVREVDENGSLGLYYEIKEEVPRIRSENESSRRKLKPKTTIRRGFIAARRRSQENYIIAPLFWENGDFDTSSGLLWLTRQQFISLKLTSETAWDIAATNGMSENTKADYELALSKLNHSGPGTQGASRTVLQIVEDSASYPVVVNGARVRLPAIKATDSLGLAEYWILDNPDNPLVLKLTYISGWATGGTGGAQGYNVFNGGGFAVVEIDF